MKAIQFEKPGAVVLGDLPVPQPDPGWARVRIRAAALCMTDFEVLAGRIEAKYPLTPGHEWSGVVDQAGSAADAAWVGKRVVADNEITCLKCRYCRRGEWRRCPDYRQIGFAAPGAYAEYLLVPVHNLYEVPDTISFEQAALLEPLGVGIAVASMSGARIGSTAIVLGAGPIGLNCLAALKASGARRILCLDRRPGRLEIARAWGAAEVFADATELENVARTLHTHGTDVVVDATGNPDMLRLGMRLARFEGVLVLAGYFGGCNVTVAPDVVHERNVRVLGAGNNAGFNETALLAAADGLIRTEGMITHRHGLADYREAFSRERVEAADYVKGVFVI